MELLKHIQELAEPSAIINDAEAVKFIFTARENFLSSSNPQVLINLSIEHDFDIIAINLINFLHKEIVECISKTDVDLLQDQNLKELLSFSCNFITLIRYLTIYSDKFCNRIHQIDNSLNVLFDVIQNKQLLDFLVDLYHQNKSNKPELLQQLYFFVRELVGIILNLSKVYDSYSDNWKQLNAVKIVLDYSEKVKDIKNSKIGPCLILANIVDENEINQYAEIRQILIPLLCKVSAFCAQNIKKKSTIYLKEIGRKVQVGVTKISNCEWNIVELMNAICKLAVRDDLKQKIYNLVKTELIEKIISNGNQIEAVFGLKLLFQLCFDKNIAKEIRENEKLLEKLNDFKIFEEVNDKELIRNVNGIVWLLNFYESQSQEGTPSEGLLSVFTDQVMISCNGECREDWGVCSKIKQDLEESNYKVWMEQTTNYDAMSRAIEESFCVLICMTDKYKKSAHCRSEAEFAYERKKPIIPLLLQDKYFPDGWLCNNLVFLVLIVDYFRF